MAKYNQVDCVHRVAGNAGSVMMTDKISEFIDNRLFKDAKGEVLIFHNHPQWFLNAVIDNLPIASSTDRNTVFNLKFNSFQILKRLFGNGDVKFYLGENGFVQEFTLPPCERIIELFSLLNSQQITFSNRSNKQPTTNN
jgi:hypothetical protein